MEGGRGGGESLASPAAWSSPWTPELGLVGGVLFWLDRQSRGNPPPSTHTPTAAALLPKPHQPDGPSLIPQAGGSPVEVPLMGGDLWHHIIYDLYAVGLEGITA